MMKYGIAVFHYLCYFHHIMKFGKRLQYQGYDLKFDELLPRLFERVPFLRLESVKKGVRVSPRIAARADRVLQVAAGNRSWTFVVAEERLGHPREVRIAVLQLDELLRSLPEDRLRYGVLLAPFISEESARICAEAGIGYADLAGNARLAFDEVFIETRSPENPFREKRETRPLFSPRAARVLRVLLQGPLRPWKVTELAAAAQVSLGWVSAVRRQLLSHEWASAESDGLRVTKPDLVLDAWARADDWNKRTRTHEYSVLVSDPLELAGRVKDLLRDEPPVFTQWFAGWLRHPHTTPAVVTAYVNKLPDEGLIEKALLGRVVAPGGGRLRLVWPKDEGVFYPTQTAQGFQLVSDVQVYLDLLCGGLRGEEQAREMRRWTDFAGGWA